jgi:hypothetical protein
MGTKHEGRWNVAKRLAAVGTAFRVQQLGAQPAAFGFTLRVHTLHGGTGHQRHEHSPLATRSRIRAGELPWWPTATEQSKMRHCVAA